MATGLEKVSFHSNPKKGNGQRMFKLLHNYANLNEVVLKILTYEKGIESFFAPNGSWVFFCLCIQKLAPTVHAHSCFFLSNAISLHFFSFYYFIEG